LPRSNTGGLVGDAASLISAFLDLRRARDNTSKVALLQERKSVGAVVMSVGVVVIAGTIFSLHLYEGDRLGFFKNIWSSFVALVASSIALAIWETLERGWLSKYVAYLQARGSTLSWLKIFLPYMLFLVMVVGCIVTYKITY
jgi:hypothetical protein